MSKRKNEPGVIITGQIIKTVEPEVVTKYQTGEVIRREDGKAMMKGYIFVRSNYAAVVLSYIIYQEAPETQSWLVPFLKSDDYKMGAQVEIGCKPRSGKVWRAKDGRWMPQELTVDPNHVKLLRSAGQMKELGVTIGLKDLQDLGLDVLFDAQPQPTPAESYNNPVQGVGNPFPQTAATTTPPSSHTASLY